MKRWLIILLALLAMSQANAQDETDRDSIGAMLGGYAAGDLGYAAAITYVVAFRVAYPLAVGMLSARVNDDDHSRPGPATTGWQDCINQRSANDIIGELFRRVAAQELDPQV